MMTLVGQYHHLVHSWKLDLLSFITGTEIYRVVLLGHVELSTLDGSPKVGLRSQPLGGLSSHAKSYTHLLCRL